MFECLCVPGFCQRSCRRPCVSPSLQLCVWHLCFPTWNLWDVRYSLTHFLCCSLSDSGIDSRIHFNPFCETIVDIVLLTFCLQNLDCFYCLLFSWQQQHDVMSAETNFIAKWFLTMNSLFKLLLPAQRLSFITLEVRAKGSTIKLIIFNPMIKVRVNNKIWIRLT